MIIPLDTIFSAEKEAWDKSVLPAPREHESFASKKTRYEALSYALSEQLFYLGYQAHHSKREKGIIKALNEFQSEMELEISNRFSTGLLELLQKLTSFEDIDDDSSYQGLTLLRNIKFRYRLVAFKLCAYGFLDQPFMDKQKKFSKKTSGIEIVDQAYERYSKTLSMLIETDSLVSSEKGSFPLIMSHDWIVRELANIDVNKVYAFRENSHRQSINNKSGFNVLMMKVAEVELWLTGYLTHPFSFLKGSGNQNPSLVKQALGDFWLAQSKENRIPQEKIVADLKSFFLRVETLKQNLDGEADVKTQYDYDSFHDNYSKVKSVKSELKKFKVEVKRSLLSRLWGGLKKVWLFIKGLFKKVIKYSKRVLRMVARNLSHIIGKIVPKTYEIVRTLLKVFKEALIFTFSGTSKYAKLSEGLIIQKKVDGDINSYIAVHAHQDLIKLIFFHMHQAAKAFRYSSGLMYEIISTFIKIATANWLSLIMAIASFGLKWHEYRDKYKDLKVIYDDLIHIEKRFESY